MLDAGAILRDGALLSLGASSLIMGTLRVNPRLFMRHFPDTVRRTQAPLSARERIAGGVVALGLALLLLGVPIVSASAYAAASSDFAYVEVFLHAFAVGMVFNLIDWLVLDELWLGGFRPSWALPPDLDPAAIPFEHSRHFRAFLSGTLVCAAVGLVATLVVVMR